MDVDMEEMGMNHTCKNILCHLGAQTTFAVMFLGLMVLWPHQNGGAHSQAMAAESDQQKVFKTAEAAVGSLLEALKNNDNNALLDIFGHEYKKYIVGTDKVAAREDRKQVYKAAQELNTLSKYDEGTRILVIGKEAWPLPFPIVKRETGWRFDTEAGIEEMLNRRIGNNELNTIATALTYVEAQVQYAAKDRDGDEVLEYAQQIGSSKGKKDGLYWEVAPGSGEEISPFGPLVADAKDYLAGRNPGDPFKGYYYKILSHQSENVPGGRYDYVINGNMIAGFALVAFPADYGSSGVMTFIVNHQGKVYENDLGENTRFIASAMEAYNPDESWTEIK